MQIEASKGKKKGNENKTEEVKVKQVPSKDLKRLCWVVVPQSLKLLAKCIHEDVIIHQAIYNACLCTEALQLLALVRR